VESLGLAGGNDNGVAIMVDVAGNDRYDVTAKDGYGIGAAKISHWGSSRESALGLGLFFDLGGTDTYNIKREGLANDRISRWNGKFPEMELNAEVGVAVDGEYDSPFFTGPRTPADDYDTKTLQSTEKERRAYRAKIGAAKRPAAAPPAPKKP
jgi:hypothetical protein